MKSVSNGFKNALIQNGRQQDVLITYKENEETKTISVEDINSVNLAYDGNILKSVMKQLTIDSNVELEVDTQINVKWGIYVGNKFEYIDLGNYIVNEVETQEDTLSYTITCYDKLLYSMVDYQMLDIEFPISVRDYINAICNKLGIEFANKEDTFCNYDQMIPNELYISADGSSLGYTFRDALTELAQVTASCICINSEDELEVRYINETNEEFDEEYLKDTNVEFGKMYGKVNSIVLSRSGDSDNVYLQDVESVQENGLCELKIQDNQVMNFNNRSDFLPDLLAYLDGLEFAICDFSSTGILYLDLLDQYTIKIADKRYKCLMLSDEIDITQGIEENIYVKEPKESETDYKSASDTDRKINQAYLIVNKQEGKITGLISTTEEHEEHLTTLDASVDEIKQSIGVVADLTRTVIGFGNVTLTKCMQGEIQKLELRGKAFEYLAPSEDLYPNNSLVPYGRNETENIMRVTNTHEEVDEETGQTRIVTVITDFDFSMFGITEPLRWLSNDVYDYFIYDANVEEVEDEEGNKTKLPKGKLYRNIGVRPNGNYYQLPTTVITPINITLDILKDTNVITFSELTNGYVSVTYVQQSALTDIFATQVQLESSITQTEREIKLEVKENFLSRDSVSSSIDLGILDDKGYIKFKTNQLEIDSDGFSLDKEGIITIDNDGTGLYGYSVTDILLVLKYVKGELTNLPQYLLDLLDADGNGSITVTDATYIMNVLNGSKQPLKQANVQMTFDIDKPSGVITIKHVDDNVPERYQTKVGLNEMYSYLMRTCMLFIGNDYVSSQLADATYGIQLDGFKKRILITDTDSSTGTTITSSGITTGKIRSGWTGQGTADGYCVVGKDTNNLYSLKQIGDRLCFYTDGNSEGFINDAMSNWIIGSMSGSDKRIKENFSTEISEELLKAIEEIEIKSFNYITLPNKKCFGIVAQDLISAFKNHGLDYREYKIIWKQVYLPNDPTEYFMVDYTEFLILKNKCLENKVKSIENRLERIEKLLESEVK